MDLRMGVGGDRPLVVVVVALFLRGVFLVLFLFGVVVERGGVFCGASLLVLAILGGGASSSSSTCCVLRARLLLLAGVRGMML